MAVKQLVGAQDAVNSIRTDSEGTKEVLSPLLRRNYPVFALQDRIIKQSLFCMSHGGSGSMSPEVMRMKEYPVYLRKYSPSFDMCIDGKIMHNLKDEDYVLFRGQN